jgi:cobalt/nickel transport system permease protein
VSHLHLPDGILPVWLLMLGWAVTISALVVASKRTPEQDRRRRIPLLGAVAALMLVAMSSEVIPIAYHVNLTVIAGILLGPWLSIPAAFVVVSILSLIGHGGVTVIGLNTVVIASEMILGAWLFRAFTSLFGRTRSGWSAAASTVLTLATTTTLLIAIVALGGPLAASRESGAFDPAQLRFENPFGGGVFGNAAFEAAAPIEEEPAPIDLKRFALMVYGLGSIGWVLEALITAGVVGFIARVRPSLVFEGVDSAARTRLGDEGVHV